MALYLRPEGRGWKRWLAGCDVSWTMAITLRSDCREWMEAVGFMSLPMISKAEQTILSSHQSLPIITKAVQTVLSSHHCLWSQRLCRLLFPVITAYDLKGCADILSSQSLFFWHSLLYPTMVENVRMLSLWILTVVWGRKATGGFSWWQRWYSQSILGHRKWWCQEIWMFWLLQLPHRW